MAGVRREGVSPPPPGRAVEPGDEGVAELGSKAIVRDDRVSGAEDGETTTFETVMTNVVSALAVRSALGIATSATIVLSP